MQVKIAPSILAGDFSALGREVEMLEKNGADWIHVDIMDGQFVPVITFGPQMVKALRTHTTLPLDVHCMVAHPEAQVDQFLEAGADVITVHAESTVHLQRLLARIRAGGAKAGVALNPATPISVLDYILDDVDMVLQMTVNPGFGGQSYISAMTEKVRAVSALTAPRNIELQVDGGVNETTAPILREAGATVLVAGSSVFKAPRMDAMIATLRGENL